MPSEINRLRVNERPPMRQYILATTPGGRTERWGFDGTDPANMIEDFSDSDSAPGGCKDFTATLPRKPGVDYSDMKMGTKTEVFGAGDYKVSEYRLERTPRTSGDILSMEPAATGYQVLLSDDEGAQEVVIDADLGGWGDPSTQRQLNLGKENYVLSASASAGFHDAGETPAGLMFDFSGVQKEAGIKPGGEQIYYGGGVDLGRLLYDFIGDGSTTWAETPALSSDDLWSSYDGPKNLNGASASQQEVAATVSGRRYAILQAFYTGAFVGQMTNKHLFTHIRVLGRHGLPLYGTWPEVGVLASDVIAYLLSRFVPGLRYTTGPYGSIKPSSFIIPHLAFKEPTTVLEIITEALRFELLEWGVWPGQFGPTFYMNPRGQREGRKRWRARIRPAQLTETGQQMDQCYNRVVMTWTDVDGTAKILGPLGSGLPLTDARCEDLDPLNPINETGEDRTRHLSMDGPATVEGAAETARLFLERCKLLDGSGEATLTGYVEDEHGAEWPYYCVKASDEIEFLGSSIPGYRYIVEARRNRKQRAANIKIDAPPDSYEALLAELRVRETAAGFS